MGGEASKCPPPDVKSFTLPDLWSERIASLKSAQPFEDADQLFDCISKERFNPDVRAVDGLRKAVDEHFGDSASFFFTDILPFIVETAARLKSLLPAEGLPLLRVGQPGVVVISRVLSASILANLLLATFRHTEVPFEASLHPLFHRDACTEQEIAKLRCFLHFFERLKENPEPEGKLYIRRRVLSGGDVPDWPKCKVSKPLNINHATTPT